MSRATGIKFSWLCLVFCFFGLNTWGQNLRVEPLIIVDDNTSTTCNDYCDPQASCGTINYKGNIDYALSPGERVRLDIAVGNNSDYTITSMRAELANISGQFQASHPSCGSGLTTTEYPSINPYDWQVNTDPFVLEISQDQPCHERIFLAVDFFYSTDSGPCMSPTICQEAYFFSLPIFGLYQEVTPVNNGQLFASAVDQSNPAVATSEEDMAVFWNKQNVGLLVARMDFEGGVLQDPFVLDPSTVGKMKAYFNYTNGNYEAVANASTSLDWYDDDIGFLGNGQLYNGTNIITFDTVFNEYYDFNLFDGTYGAIVTLLDDDGLVALQVNRGSNTVPAKGFEDYIALGQGDVDGIFTDVGASLIYFEPEDGTISECYGMVYEQHDTVGAGDTLEILVVDADDINTTQGSDSIAIGPKGANPNIVWDEERGLLVVVWQEDAGGIEQIYAMVYRWDEGQPVGSRLVPEWPGPQVISNVSAGFRATLPQVFFEGYDFYVVWMTEDLASFPVAGKVEMKVLPLHFQDFDPLQFPDTIIVSETVLQIENLTGFMGFDRSHLFWSDFDISTSVPQEIVWHSLIPQDPIMPYTQEDKVDIFVSQPNHISGHPTIVSKGDEYAVSWYYQENEVPDFGQVFFSIFDINGQPVTNCAGDPKCLLSEDEATQPRDSKPLVLLNSATWEFETYWYGVDSLQDGPGDNNPYIRYTTESDIGPPTGSQNMVLLQDVLEIEFFDAAISPAGDRVVVFRDKRGADVTGELYVFSDTGPASPVKIPHIGLAGDFKDAAITSSGDPTTPWALLWSQCDGANTSLYLAMLDSNLSVFGGVQTLDSTNDGCSDVREVDIDSSGLFMSALFSFQETTSNNIEALRVYSFTNDGTLLGAADLLDIGEDGGGVEFLYPKIHWSGTDFLVSTLIVGPLYGGVGATQNIMLYTKLNQFSDNIRWFVNPMTAVMRPNLDFNFDMADTLSGTVTIYMKDTGSFGGNVLMALQGWSEDNVYCQLFNSPPTVLDGGPYTIEFGGTANLSGTAGDDDLDDSLFAQGWDLDNDNNIDQTGPIVALTPTLQAQYGINDLGVFDLNFIATDENTTTTSDATTLTVQDTTNPSATLIKPNGGESLIEASSYVITWTGSDNHQIDHFELHYCTDWNGANCTSSWQVINDNLASTANSHTWTPLPSITTATLRVRVTAEDVIGNRGEDLSNNNVYLIQATTDAIETVILWSKNRIEGQYAGQGNTLEAKLIELRDNNKVNGVILNLDNVPAVVTAFSNWDAAPTDNALANAVTTAIQSYLYNTTDGQISKTYSNAKYLVIAGDDRQIPFRRLTDYTSLFSENTYVSSVNVATTVGSAISNNMYLSDDYLADYGGDTTLIGNTVLYLPDVVSGRLVESPADMALTINNFISKNGQIKLESPERILVTGRDSFTDSALEIRNAYSAKPSFLVDSLLDMVGENPAWTKANLTTQLFGTFHSLNNINGHADHYSIDASDGFLTTTEMQAQGNLPGGVMYAIGCHSGLPLASPNPNSLDLPELFMQKGVVAYIANTGYGWGLRPGVGYSESLMKLITEEILAKDLIALGDALSAAKRRYYLTDRRYDVYDEKVLMQATLFGLPMYSVVVKNPSFAPPPLKASDLDDVQTRDGITVKKRLVDEKQAANLPPGVTRLELNFVFRDPLVPLTDPNSVYKQVDTADGSYFNLNGESTGEVNETIQPRFMYDSKLSGTMQHGTVFIGGQFSEITGFSSAVAVPVSNNEDDADPNNNSTPTPAPKLGSFVPAGRSTTLYTQSAVCAPTTSTFSNLTVTTGEFRGGGVERLFNQMEFASYYSTFCDVNAPTITDPGASAHTLSGLNAIFSVSVTDVEASIHRVLVTWTDDKLLGTNTTGTWQSLDLVHTSGNNTSGQTSTWTGTLALKRDIRYILQAVDADGNVDRLLQVGSDQNAEGTNFGSLYSSWKVLSVTLPDGDSDGMPDAWETANGTNPASNDAASDPDADGLTNLQEFNGDTHPTRQDTDGDGDNDGSEVANNRNPLLATDGHSIIIGVTSSGNDITVNWTADATNTEGPYYVYRGTNPFMSPANLIATKVLPTPATSHTDLGAIPGPTYYYWVTNVAVATIAPSVLFVAPNNGPQVGGTSIQIFGNNFVSGSTVAIGGNPCTTVAVSSNTSLTCTTPSGTAGAKAVTVTSPNDQFGTLSGGFTYN